MNLRQRLTGATATLLITALLIGMPWLLLNTTGNPIPNRLPTADEITGWFTRPDDGTLALGAIRYAAWLVWLVLAGTLVVEIAAAARGMRPPRLPGLRLPQLGANRLVAAAAMLFLTLPTLAAAAPAWADPTTPVATAPENPVTTEPATRTTMPATAVVGLVEHVVVRGDTLSGLAATYLGDAELWPEIFHASTGITQPGGRHLTNPDLIIPGWTLRIPTTPSTPATSAPGFVEHVVTSGDTLTGLAKTYLGDSARWPEIFAASTGLRQPGGRRLKNPDLIVDGWTLHIPTLEAPVSPAQNAAPEIPPAPTTPDTSASVETAAPTTPPASPRPSAATAGSTATSDQAQATASGGQVPDASGVGESMSAPWLLTGFTIGGAVLAGSALLALRRRRQHQFRLRRPGRALASPSPALAPVERTITVVGTVSAPTVEFMDRALRHLATHRTQQGLPMPALDRVDLTSQDLVAHFDSPATLGDPWHTDDDTGMCWRITPDAVLSRVDDQPAPYPLLVTVGTTDDGSSCLLNLEQFGTVLVTGDPDYSLDFIRYVAAELAVNPWSRDVRIACLGVADEITTMNASRFRPARDTAATAADMLDDAAATAGRISDAGTDLVSARVQQLTSETWTAQALLIDADTATHQDIQDLTQMIADQPGATPTAIVITGNTHSIEGTELRVTPTGRIQNRQTGLDLVVVGLTHDEALGCAALLAQAETAKDRPMPTTSTAVDGWRSLADDAGALRPDIAAATTQQAAVRISLVGENPTHLPSPQAPDDTTHPVGSVSAQLRLEVEAADPDLDQDVRDWFASECDRPRLTLLGPVGVRAHGTPMAKRKPFFIEVLAYLALREHGATAEEVAAAFGYNLSTIRNSVKVVRDWLGINPRTGERHLPEASKSRAAQLRGIPVYQVDDLLVDIDLFRRLRLRGDARGDAGITDLVTALGLVTGRPFSQLRPDGWSWLSDLNIDHHMVCAIVDVAHHLSSHFLRVGDLRRARAATETALLAAPYDAMTKLDLAVVTKAEGHLELARQIVHDVCNEPDEDGLPSDLNDSIGAYVASMEWFKAS
jgi:nucleoid-associated protein YgaU